jgi:ArsR family transcriptional regulator
VLLTVKAELLRVLADPLRLQVVALLAREALCTSHLVAETGARQTNLSNHLRVLREAGLVEPEPRGRYTYYRLRPEVLTELADTFAELAHTAGATRDTARRRAC